MAITVSGKVRFLDSAQQLILKSEASVYRPLETCLQSPRILAISAVPILVSPASPCPSIMLTSTPVLNYCFA
jgi:hypothetical protein